MKYHPALRTAWLGSVALALGAVAATLAEEPARVTALKAARIHTLTGAPLEGGTVLIRDGRIEAVGPDVAIPPGAEVITLKGGVVTPGLIDACCTIDPEVLQEARSWAYGAPPASLWKQLGEHARLHEATDDVCGPACGGERGFADAPTIAAADSPNTSVAEQSSEVTPHRLVIDAVNLLSNDFARLAKGGVTTVYVSPDSANVIGSRGAIVRTAGLLNERIVRRADAIKVSLGDDPSSRGAGNNLPPTYGPPPSFHTRRPTTRMGVEWVFRKALYDTERATQGLGLHGADQPPRAAIPVLQQMLAGQIPVRIQARMQHDIFTALRLASEFKLQFILEEATEAYRCLPQLQAANVPVIYGPIFMTASGWRAATDEARHPRLNVPRLLADAGIRFALTAQEGRADDGLVRQGMYAVANGLPAEEALRAITATPAQFLGLAGEVGTVAPGMRADLVVWSAEPFDATSRPLLVLIGGRVVHNAREE